MLMESSDLREYSIKFEQGKKFSSRRMCRETSVIDSVVEVYYGGASGSVPFLWESQPGTPKVKLPVKPFPPVLTPPPLSFHYSTIKSIKKPSKPTLVHAILSKLLGRKTSRQLSRSSSSSTSFSLLSSSWSSFRSVPSSLFPDPNVPRKCPGSSFRSRIGEEEQYESPVLCFGRRNSWSCGCLRT
ncbi:uncharacterized protein LOC130794470 [Actinidia eriantha]|uniref:uncharacterized protein LOC130794470 n=1 Tax=Actinidia eriantha TaxID=165200 RepID=UPI00258F9D0D|nr:uncharacterized protein LOC130794470 [Actinidia eriantha]